MSSPRKIISESRTILADLCTPVSIYLRVRDRFPNAVLLESAEFSSNEDCLSIICCEPIAEFKVRGKDAVSQFKQEDPITVRLEAGIKAKDELKKFVNGFTVESRTPAINTPNGLFGYITYDAVSLFENIELKQSNDITAHIPSICYQAFRYVIAVNPINNQLSITRNAYEGELVKAEEFEELVHIITQAELPKYGFVPDDEMRSNFSDKEFLERVNACKEFIQKGEVFQIVPSRRFSMQFKGDEFNLYRALRSINPSPYLFYFDYGDFRILGSSPEAQLQVKNGKASLFPIAGTYKRRSDAQADLLACQELLADVKESAEHVMLVDLARNDLSRSCKDVHVEKFKEIKLYSHVIHMRSTVSATLGENVSAVDLIADTFPMGTVTGAPKYRAMQLIDQLERGTRGSYGGALGYFGFDGNSKHTLVIRSFLSSKNYLYFQAGAGVVARSNPQTELEEINTKLGALRAAIQLAKEI